MAEAAGFTFERVGASSSLLAPLVLLHGSGGCEMFLMGFARRVAPDRGGFAVRGPVPWEDGFAFFRRNADRTLDRVDLATQSSAFCGFLRHLVEAGSAPPILVGYSNGAILAAAAVLHSPELTSGAVLLRPLSPCAEARFPSLPGYPVLLLGGARDVRREAVDMPRVAAQFLEAGALVTAQVLPVGHGMEGGLDEVVVRAWLAAQGTR